MKLSQQQTGDGGGREESASGTSERPRVTHSVDLQASPEEVWAALATDHGRTRWLESDPDRILIVEREQSPTHISWWWWSEGEPPSHVDIRVVSIATGTRVIVTETAPGSFPLASMTAFLRPALALV